jgi:hypothetical protein
VASIVYPTTSGFNMGLVVAPFASRSRRRFLENVTVNES